MQSITEAVNPLSENLDQLSSFGLVELFADDSLNASYALKKAAPEMAKCIDSVYLKLKEGGSLFYLGAGTSGRLGILDAVECPPTFSTESHLVQGIIAGGNKAFTEAVEGAEDNEEAGFNVIKEMLTNKDALICISASGGAAYVIGALKAANELGIYSAAISNNSSAPCFDYTENTIFLDTGAEILSGSTRLKAGTSQKIALNTISTSVMVKLGKTYSNLMIDVKVTNKKLHKRALTLIQKITRCDETRAGEALEKSQNKVKQAILLVAKDLNFKEASELLETNNGFLSKIL